MAKWTTTPPKESGWYWARGDDWCAPVEVMWDGDEFVAWRAGEEEFHLDNEGWLWWSVPLTPPEPPEVERS